MKKRFLSSVLLLSLCLTMTVSVSSAYASDLDQAASSAYYDILTMELNQYGMASSTKQSGMEYAALEDMDGDGSPELATIRYDQDPQATAYITVWTMKDGQAVKVLEEGVYPGGTLTEARIFFVRQGKEVAICNSFEWYENKTDFAEGGWLVFTVHRLDGTTETFRADTLSEKEATRSAFEKAWTADQVIFLGGYGMWLHDEDAAQTVEQVRDSLQVQDKQPVSSTSYASYILEDGYGDRIFFDSAKAEPQTVQIRDRVTMIGGEVELTSYREMEVTLVTLKPGSGLQVFLSPDLFDNDLCGIAEPNGSGRFTHVYEDCVMYPLEARSFQEDLKKTGVFLWGKDTTYLVIYENVLHPNNVFVDVSESAYYADAVKWAVENRITTGTGSNTFSPNQTCSVAEITTFLWRAKGSPLTGPGGFYDDVKPTDWYVDAANWAYAADIALGHFGGEEPCTRALVMTYLWILAGRPDAPSSGFSDVPDGQFYTKAVAWAVHEGITAGTSETTFSPDIVCTRGQVMTFLYRAMG